MYKVKDYILDLQKRGKLTFTLQDIRERFPAFSEVAIKSALRRVSIDCAVMSVRKGFYAIVPVGYALRGTVPPELYIDDLMKHLHRSYYVGLLSAAAYYGAAHQQPQAFSVITPLPQLRDIVKKNVHINFIATGRDIPQTWLKPFRTENGDIMVSKPELTAADIITFQKDIGGLSRAATILYELADVLDFKQLDRSFFDFVSVATIQRMGYLLKSVLEQSGLSDELYIQAQTHKCRFLKIPLKHSKSKDGYSVDKRWKIIVNEQAEADDL